MVPHERQHFNAAWTPEKYRAFLRQLDSLCRCKISFRVSETPLFLPRALAEQMAQCGRELITQLLQDPEYRRASDAAVPQEWNAPHEDETPLFVCVDFGIVRNAQGEFEPKLVELQAFPSLYAFQYELAELFKGSYGLKGNTLFSGFDRESYAALLRRVIVGEHPTENVVLLEIDPYEQKTLPDFLLTQRMLGIPIVDIGKIEKQNKKLFYRSNGRPIRIERIYNRTIVDELERKQLAPPFDYRDELDLEWAGHPNWYFRISKFSIPFLRHACVPRTWFLHELDGKLPLDREQLLLKPLYSFAGAGIVFAPADAQLAAIPEAEKKNYILQEKMSFVAAVETPHGATQAEVRIMYIWPPGEPLQPVLPLVRMGRGKMMGVDHNKNLEWVGASAALIC